MTLFVAIVFGLTYLGMAFGRIRGLAVDRTGIALLAAVIVIASGALDGEAALATVDLPTLLLLFGLLILSAQYRVAGFYDWCAQRVAVAPARAAGAAGSDDRRDRSPFGGAGERHRPLRERAAAAGVRLSFRDHARSGIPVTLGSIAFAAVWLRATGHIGW